MRILILLAFVCLYFPTLQGQETNKKSNIIIGVQVGGALSRASEKKSSDRFKQESVLRPVFGLYADIANTHLVSFRAGISYLMLGNKANYGTTIRKTKLDYLAIPFLAKYKARNGEFAVFAGPQIGLLTNAQIRSSSTKWADIKNECEKTDIAGILGFSIEPINSPVNFILSGQLSFTKVYKEIDGGDLYNRGITLAVQYKLFKN